MNIVLSATDSTSREFRHPGGIALIELDDFTGSTTWKLQYKSFNSDVWRDVVGIQFTGYGQLVWYGSTETLYRLDGGEVGATASILSTTLRPGLDGR